MTLLSLYHTHAAVCVEMAAISKTREIKERWLELADHWRQKASDIEGLPEAAAEPSPPRIPAVMAPDSSGEHTLSATATTGSPASQDVMVIPNAPAPSLSPSSDDVSNPQVKMEAGDEVTPSISPSLHEVSNPQLQEAANDLTPSLSPSLHEGTNPQPQIAGHDVATVIELDDDWKQILADIRGK